VAVDAARLGARRPGRFGDRSLYALTGGAAAGAVALVLVLVWMVLREAWPAMHRFGFGFLWHRTWDPIAEHFGALSFVYGTVVTSFLALAIAGPVSIAIGLYLSELAPRGVRGTVGALVELLAAVPSVVIGLWGILVLGPVVQHQLEPWLGSTLGFLPFFRGPHQVVGLLPAVIVLAIMIVPIASSVARELFLTVPRELKEGALALGMTRWEMVRGVVLPSTRSGLVAALGLGLGRALGEAIAVTQVIGNANAIHLSLFQPGDTLASRLASTYQGATSHLQVASLVYLAAILLAITLVVNLAARLVVRAR
jgi:phosphate transport system permease protein